MMNKGTSIFLSAVKVAPLSMLYLILFMSSSNEFDNEYIYIFIFGTLISGVIALVLGTVIFTSISIYENRSTETLSAQAVFVKYLPLFVFSFSPWPIYELFISESSDKLYTSVLMSAYLSSVSAWYFFTQDYYRKSNKTI